MTKVFVACPIGADGSPARLRADKLWKHVIAPVVTEVTGKSEENVLVRSDKMGEPGRITTQIIRELGAADVLIADLTDLNANVMYELGLRQASMKPYILMAEEKQTLPFDLSDFRTIFYVLDLDGVEKAQSELRSHLKKALSGEMSAIDRNLFAQLETDKNQSEPNQNQDFLEIVEACNQVLRETQEVKVKTNEIYDVLMTVGSLTVDMHNQQSEEKEEVKQQRQQEIGMWLFQQMLQNPENMEKAIPAMKTLAEFGQSQQPTDAKVPPPNRAARRKQTRT